MYACTETVAHFAESQCLGPIQHGRHVFAPSKVGVRRLADIAATAMFVALDYLDHDKLAFFHCAVARTPLLYRRSSGDP